MTSVELGCLGPAPRDPNDPHHRLLHLPDPGLVVSVECRLRASWWCGVVAVRTGTHPAHVELGDDQLAHAPRTITADPVNEPDLFAMLWQTRVRQQWRGGHTTQLAQIMAESLRRPGSLTIDIDTEGARRLATAARLRTPALRLLLSRFADAGMLTSDNPGPTVAGVYALTLPEPLRRHAPASPLAATPLSPR